MRALVGFLAWFPCCASYSEVFVHDKGSPAVGFFPGRRLASSEERREIVATAMYGSINDYAYYFIDVLIGTPPQRQSVILDTGSSLMGFPCQPCEDCGEHLDAYFDVGASHTADRFNCTDPRCVINSGSCAARPVDDTCLYHQPYLEGSVIDGYFVSDVVRLGQNPEAPARRYDHVGCHMRVTKMFREQQANGILGVSFPRQGGPGKAQPTIVDIALGSPTINAKVFAICLSEDGGVFSVGGYATDFHKNSYSYEEPLHSNPQERGYARFFGLFKKILAVQDGEAGHVRGNGWRVVNQRHPDVLWVQLVSKTAYLVPIRFVRAGARTETLVAGSEALMDSGTTYSYFPAQTYVLIESFLFQLCKDFNVAHRISEEEIAEENRCGREIHRNHCVTRETMSLNSTIYGIDPDILCFSWPQADEAALQVELDRMDSIWLALGKNTIVQWKAESWLFRKAPGRYCAAVETHSNSKQVILGLSFMKQKQIIFDRENDLIGFVAANCPIHLEQSRTAKGQENTLVINYATTATGETDQGVAEPAANVDPAVSVDPAYLAGNRWTGRLEGLDRPSMTPWAMAGGLTLSVIAALGCMARRSLRRTEEATADSPGYVPYIEEVGLAELGGGSGFPDYAVNLDLERRPN